MPDPKKKDDLSPEERRLADQYQKEYDAEQAKDDNLREAGVDPDMERYQEAARRKQDEWREVREAAAAKDRADKIDYMNKHMPKRESRVPAWGDKVPLLGPVIKHTFHPDELSDDEKVARADDLRKNTENFDLALKVARERYKAFYGPEFETWARKTQNELAEDHPKLAGSLRITREPTSFVRGDENEAGASEEKLEAIRKAMQNAKKK
jgi:phosphoenolpyruvate-protein kinase (PTS system EI component)